MGTLRPIFRSFLSTGLFLFGCGASAAPTDPATPAGQKLAQPDSSGQLSLAVAGQAEVAPGVVLTLERVVADSRCPVDVTCVWAGEIRLAFALESPQGEAPRLEFELATTAPTAEVRGLRFELLGVTPEARSTRKLTAADYRIALQVTPSASRELR